ncbi:MAG: SurA N-terminal domain-containing protein, partial [Bacillota bacterium]
MNILKWKALFLLVLAVPLFYLGTGCTAQDSTVAVVNNRTISRQQLDRFINVMRLCNPDLDQVLVMEQEGGRRQVELEFLQILIDIELVRQAIEKAAVAVEPELVALKTDQLLDELAVVHYSGSREQLDRRCKQLDLSAADLQVIPAYELQLQKLFDHITATITETDLRLFVEENPEMLIQGAALQVYRLSFMDEQSARRSLLLLQQDQSVEASIMLLQDEYPGMSAEALGWITADDPFIDAAVKDRLFSLPDGVRG